MTSITYLFDCFPDVVYEILSHLDMEDISRLSVVSKTCRKLCISTPFLTLDDTKYRGNASKRARFINYLDRFLFLHRRVGFQYLHICWSMQSSPIDEEYRLLSWLHYAIQCNVKHLDLDIILRNESNFALPSSLFRCVSLKSLAVKFHNGIVKIPSSIAAFSSLKCLKLHSVQIDESFGKWISSYFESLEELCLTDFKGTKRIDITSSSLTLLEIFSTHELFHLQVSAEALKMMDLCWVFHSLDNRELKLFTPKLESLTWIGNISKLQFMGNFKHLEEVALLLIPNFDIGFTQNLVDLLDAVHNVPALMLDNDTLKPLKQACINSPRPIWFTSLSKLFIQITTISDDQVLAMAAIFERTPNLHYLRIRRETDYTSQTNVNAEAEDGGTMGSWELRDGMAVQNLNFVTMNLVSLGTNELKLIKYLLKYAYNLQKMTLYLDHSLLSDVEREINQYEKASNAQVKYEGL